MTLKTGIGADFFYSYIRIDLPANAQAIGMASRFVLIRYS